MSNLNPKNCQQTEFAQQWQGIFYSLMSWQQLKDFWPKIDTGAGWYLYAIGEAVPQGTTNAEHVAHFIQEVDVLLHRDHEESYCGIVFADDVDQPSMIKIYDPNNLGVSCGSSKNPPLPGWVMSRIPPDELQPRGIIPAGRKRWWQSLPGNAS